VTDRIGGDVDTLDTIHTHSTLYSHTPLSIGTGPSPPAHGTHGASSKALHASQQPSGFGNGPSAPYGTAPYSPGIAGLHSAAVAGGGGGLDSPTPSIRAVPVCPAKEEEAAAAAITRASLEDIIEACQILDIEV
jgi:hypothetical protein